MVRESAVAGTALTLVNQDSDCSEKTEATN